MRLARRPMTEPTAASPTESDPIGTALSLLQRRVILQRGLRANAHGDRLAVEREILRIGRQLAAFPDALQAITQAAAELQRPPETLSLRDVARRRRFSNRLTAGAHA